MHRLIDKSHHAPHQVRKHVKAVGFGKLVHYPPSADLLSKNLWHAT